MAQHFKSEILGQRLLYARTSVRVSPRDQDIFPIRRKNYSILSANSRWPFFNFIFHLNE